MVYSNLAFLLILGLCIESFTWGMRKLVTRLQLLLYSTHVHNYLVLHYLLLENYYWYNYLIRSTREGFALLCGQMNESMNQ